MKRLAVVLLSLFLFACVGSLELRPENLRAVRTINLSCPEQVGVAVSEHILIVRIKRGGHCCDDSRDREGNLYYCYMLDLNNGLKAMVTKETLSPTFNMLEKDVLEFHALVKKEIEKDGGIDALIQRFSTYGSRMEFIGNYLMKAVLSKQEKTYCCCREVSKDD